MHDGSSPAGRDRSSSLQGMDMASLPPRKRPWQDGPGTGDPRERDSSCADGGERQSMIPLSSLGTLAMKHRRADTTGDHCDTAPLRSNDF